MSHAGGLGLSSPLQESMLMNDQTEYRVPVNVPVLHDLSVPNMYHTPQAVEMSSMVENSTSQTGNSIFSPVPQMQAVGHAASLPVLQNMTQHVPQQFIQFPQIGQNMSLPVSQHFAQQIPPYFIQHQPVQSPLHQAQQLQQNLQQRSVQSPQQNAQQLQHSLQQQLVQNPQQQPVQNLQQIGADGGLRADADRGPGAIPRPGNPFYIPTTNNQDRIISSTPPTQAQYVHRSPNLSPINLRAPPGFVYPPQEQGPNQVHNTRLNRNVENNSEYDRAQISQN